MTIMKTVLFRVVYYGIALIKLPFSLIVGIGLQIEKIFMWLMTKVAKWYGDENIITGVNAGLTATSYGMECWSDTYLDMKIEL